jgi:hypothetical protein
MLAHVLLFSRKQELLRRWEQVHDRTKLARPYVKIKTKIKGHMAELK